METATFALQQIWHLSIYLRGRLPLLILKSILKSNFNFEIKFKLQFKTLKHNFTSESRIWCPSEGTYTCRGIEPSASLRDKKKEFMQTQTETSALRGLYVTVIQAARPSHTWTQHQWLGPLAALLEAATLFPSQDSDYLCRRLQVHQLQCLQDSVTVGFQCMTPVPVHAYAIQSPFQAK